MHKYKRVIPILLFFSIFCIVFTSAFSFVIEDIEKQIDENITNIGEESGWELIERGPNWNRYYNASSGQYSVRNHLYYINYLDGDTYLPINTSFEIIDSNHLAYSYGYRVGNEKGIYNAYFKPNPSHDFPIVYTYNKNDSDITHSLRFEPVGFAYLDPSNNNEYTFLQTNK